jgi:hypothetical protein
VAIPPATATLRVKLCARSRCSAWRRDVEPVQGYRLAATLTNPVQPGPHHLQGTFHLAQQIEGVLLYGKLLGVFQLGRTGLGIARVRASIRRALGEPGIFQLLLIVLDQPEETLPFLLEPRLELLDG